MGFPRPPAPEMPSSDPEYSAEAVRRAHPNNSSSTDTSDVPPPDGTAPRARLMLEKIIMSNQKLYSGQRSQFSDVLSTHCDINPESFHRGARDPGSLSRRPS